MNERLAAARAYVEKKPSDKFGLYTLAMELRKEAEWSACFSAFDTLLAHHPDYGAAFYHYAVAARPCSRSPSARSRSPEARAATA